MTCALFLTGCAAMPLMRGPEVSESACAASCNTHFDQCPQIFAGFPERGAIECPAEHDKCLKSCETRRSAVPAVAGTDTRPTEVLTGSAGLASPRQIAPGPVHPTSSKEARLRELKHLYDEGLVTEDVYKDQQKAILSEP
jgi:hypothetical protein